GDCSTDNEIASKGMNLLESLSLEALLVTQGENGMTLVQRDDTPVHLSAQAHEVFDITGAGDTVIATLAAALASGHDLVHATSLANRAAGLVVEKLGAATVTTKELNNAVVQSHFGNAGIIEESSLKSLLDNIRSEGKKIVMTNGCFDILHAGHVSYLKQAKALGDYLIVAVNDDDSVFRLKGDNRPINCLEHRLTVLDALDSVDWIISFSEDTPERLINGISPDVLVKGGDYKPGEVAGAENVKQNGG
ncbi:bifunctional heptose 7-phosphate kinase/heptose 1-phosphate adenyltransferase, partial [Streptococcus pseudopneumoniae]